METGEAVRIYIMKNFVQKNICFCESLIEKKYAFPIDTLGKNAI